MSKKFILIGHKKRQGKDTFALMLANKLGNAEIMAFADPMKEIMGELIGMTGDEYNLLKNLDPRYRELLKSFGNGKIIEYFGEQVWRDVLLSRAEKSNAEYIIVPDFRRNREMIDGAITINIKRDAEHQDEHISETELDNLRYDIVINNYGDLDELQTVTNFVAHNIVSSSRFNSREEEMKFIFPMKSEEREKVEYNDLVKETINTLAKNVGIDFEEAERSYQNLLKDDEHEENIEKVYGDVKEVSLGKGELFINNESKGVGEIFCRFR